MGSTIRGKLNSTVALGLAVCGPVMAHHSVGAFFDTSAPMVIEGTVTAASWRNPHALLTVERDGGNGVVETWHVESGGPTLLRRVGVNPDIVDPGDFVRISGYPSKIDHREMLGAAIELSDGRSLPMFPTLAARFGIQVRSGVHITGQAAEAGERAASGIYRVWTYGRVSDRPVADAVYTPRALARQQEYDPLVDDPALRCEAQGMPLIMDNPFPIRFSDHGDTIVLELEIWDIVRTIQLTDGASAEAHRGTPLGYSRGRWEGDTLIVATSDIDSLYIDDAGTPQSDLVEVVERFTLSEDQRRLDYEAAVTDPETLLEPMALAWHWDWVPGEALQSYGCTLPE